VSSVPKTSAVNMQGQQRVPVHLDKNDAVQGASGKVPYVKHFKWHM